MASISGFLSKALSPAYYQSQYKNFLVSSYNYYHPLFRTGRYVGERASVSLKHADMVSKFNFTVFISLSFCFFSAVPLWHMMMGVSFIMYTTSYMARDCKSIAICDGTVVSLYANPRTNKNTCFFSTVYLQTRLCNIVAMCRKLRSRNIMKSTGVLRITTKDRPTDRYPN